MRSRVILFCLCAVVTSEVQPPAKISVETPHCRTKQGCDELWEVPNLSNCIDNVCVCTGGSRFVESNKTCECQLGQVAGRTECLPAATERGASCREDVQCKLLGELVVCDEGECRCARDAVIVDGACFQKKFPSEYCDSDGECEHIGKAFCRQNLCSCDEGHVASPDKQACLPILKGLHDPCVQDIQCSESFGPGRRCHTRCVCRDDFHEVNNECVENKGLGEQCSSHSDCHVESGIDGSELTCVEGKCDFEKGQRKESNPGRNTGAHSCSSFILFVTAVMFVSLDAFFLRR
ncbi:prion-like-(Q/N-rich) domain-bearing protein 25 isoform X1 [Zootermopsis nevadensis]|uniref:prion-like-(Q/N-rich) domain-bearing protein 25 isoform X1 n=1 Tax=Zootermopsis nevadensis TaxID=136037 RepID=UPI000B8E4A0F|nr:prion-like-(Q/N-rich) domain-bearing protein 25 isoform X1 [Zootermopsis nevadensis]